MLGFAPLGSLPLGTVPELSGSYKFVAETATFSLTGNDVGLYANRVLTAECGVFTLTFNSSDYARTRNGLNMRSGGGARGIQASAGGGGKGLRIRA